MATAEELGVDNVLELLTGVFELDGEVRNNEFHMLCVNPEHNDHDPSLHVSLKTGIWNCWSCDFDGDLIELGHIIFGKSRKSVRTILQPNDPDSRRAIIKRRLQARKDEIRPVRQATSKHKLIIPGEGSYADGPMSYLRERGFNRRTIEKWGIRYVEMATLFKEDGDSFEIRDCIGIPVLSEKGDVVAWCYRATPKSPGWLQNVRYLYTPGVTQTLSKMWFGLNNHTNAEEITVCEGALDAIWCDQNGIPAVAILGSQVKQSQKVKLLGRFRKVTLLTDRDTAGVTTAYGLGEALLKRGVPVRVCRYPSFMVSRQGKPAKDAQDLCGLDLELVHARAIPFLAWKHQYGKVA